VASRDVAHAVADGLADPAADLDPAADVHGDRPA
jgi:hypothetical protein